jgi:hypothetical protein
VRFGSVLISSRSLFRQLPPLSTKWLNSIARLAVLPAPLWADPAFPIWCISCCNLPLAVVLLGSARVSLCCCVFASAPSC